MQQYENYTGRARITLQITRGQWYSGRCIESGGKPGMYNGELGGYESALFTGRVAV